MSVQKLERAAVDGAVADRPDSSAGVKAGRAKTETAHPVRSYSAALLTLGAAAIHFGVAPEHFDEYLPYGLFFAALGLAQLGLAAAILLRPSRRLFVVAASGTAGVIAIWLISRTVGMPIGPQPWEPASVGFIDLQVTVMEAVTLVLFLRRIRTPFRKKARGRARVALTNAPALLAASLAVIAGGGVAANPMVGAFNAAPAVPGQATTSVVSLTVRPGSEPLKIFTLTAARTNIGAHQAWAFNGTVPGPELRVTQGDRVRVTLVNHLPGATSIHWHGIRVPNAVDGVAGITQDAVRPGASYVYEFIATDVGTYWYHSHQDTSRQIPRGLFGSIVVEARGGVVLRARDYSLMIHTLPDTKTVAVNGSTNLHLDAAPGDTVRLRLINAVSPQFDGMPVMPVLLGAPYTVSALDGHDLNGPQELGPQRIPLGMGQRADLVFKMPAIGSVRLIGISGPTPVLPLLERMSAAAVTIGDGPAPAAVNVDALRRFDLTSYGVPSQDSVADAGSYDVNQQIVIAGSPMFRNGSFELALLFNRHASPYVPPIHVHEGQLVRLHIVSATTSDTWHPIHIHGHIFSVLAKNGVRLSGSPVHLDTILVGPRETWDLAFRADNPGVWMLHCHVLIHAAEGMSMTVNYDGISTPFTMGRRSGNVPE